ncbi:hypothetical protein H5410_019832 [Solanum commersonii]|uniref:Uncharacterized protein n=1 Tax=Solanum commersonii TaxID=4109 RepID=A0A9J5Z9G8_SOLCO|nr:hypothetical protein H5410_019832 [Solanum commersonii]
MILYCSTRWNGACGIALGTLLCSAKLAATLSFPESETVFQTFLTDFLIHLTANLLNSSFPVYDLTEGILNLLRNKDQEDEKIVKVSRNEENCQILVGGFVFEVDFC